MKKEELTIIERQILMNQEMILAKLYPEEKEFHEERADLFKRGIAWTYNISLEDEVPYEVYTETFDILNMFLKLEAGKASLSDEEKADLDLSYIDYKGFDYNLNSTHVRVLDYLATKPLYQEYDKNSHTESSLFRYRRMLEIYKQEVREFSWDLKIDKNFLIKMINGMKRGSEANNQE